VASDAQIGQGGSFPEQVYLPDPSIKMAAFNFRQGHLEEMTTYESSLLRPCATSIYGTWGDRGFVFNPTQTASDRLSIGSDVKRADLILCRKKTT